MATIAPFVPKIAPPDAFADRCAPYSAEAELAVLGGMLIDADALTRAIEVVDDSMFYREGNRRAFRAMRRIFERGDVIDPVTLAEELRNAGDLEATGGLQFIASVLDAVPTAANIEYHARIVREKAVLRRLIEAQHRSPSRRRTRTRATSTSCWTRPRAASFRSRRRTSARASSGSRSCCGRRWSASSSCRRTAPPSPACPRASGPGRDDGRVPEGRPGHRRRASLHGQVPGARRGDRAGGRQRRDHRGDPPPPPRAPAHAGRGLEAGDDGAQRLRGRRREARLSRHHAPGPADRDHADAPVPHRGRMEAAGRDRAPASTSPSRAASRWRARARCASARSSCSPTSSATAG